ncbi:NUDIX hydrolase [Streptomyces lavendulae]|uniref:NUDIX hydrolase n=1 Tax=Streptomyces lavendulae TaxID=1914 RepID=UPI0024A084E7|nr:NUDIX domain-containing protein [Streptomyces lavendulae]GLX20796.1 DNA mismatch repair protein MutT [Streptomyces lavendulae subsp. lavendulae]GLX28042.1 DNA mismatch repair protein MutT [Streptomyces lavendulae subsp. lavendulae]
MKERVRAVLVTADGTMLVIRRTKPDVPRYWVLPGGGVEPGDESLEAALHREIHEEIAGKADIVRLLHTIESDEERQLFYLARITTWSFDDRTGPEFSAEGRGEYALEEVPLTVEGLDGINLKPEEIAHVLRGAISAGNLAPFGN